MIIKKFFLAAFLVSIVGFGGIAEAQTTTTVLSNPNAQKLAALTVQVESAQMELIKQLIAQVSALQEQLNKLLATQGQVSVPVSSVRKIAVDLKIDGLDGPLVLKPGYAKFTWKTNAESCIASGDVEHWTGDKAASGEARVWVANEKYGVTTYSLECSRANFNSEGDSVKVTFDYGTPSISQKPIIDNVTSKASESWEIIEGKDAYIYGKGLSGELVIQIGNREPKFVTTTDTSDTQAQFIVPKWGYTADVNFLVTNSKGLVSDPKIVKIIYPDDEYQHVLPSCSLTTNKSSYKLGETITFSWTSQNATYATFWQDNTGKDHLILPGDKLSTSGSQSVTANVIGNPGAKLLIYNSYGNNSCSVNISVN